MSEQTLGIGLPSTVRRRRLFRRPSPPTGSPLSRRSHRARTCRPLSSPLDRGGRGRLLVRDHRHGRRRRERAEGSLRRQNDRRLRRHHETSDPSWRRAGRVRGLSSRAVRRDRRAAGPSKGTMRCPTTALFRSLRGRLTAPRFLHSRWPRPRIMHVECALGMSRCWTGGLLPREAGS